MIGELLYHLHRHIRLLLIAGGLVIAVSAVALGYEAVRHMGTPSSARPAETGRA